MLLWLLWLCLLASSLLGRLPPLPSARLAAVLLTGQARSFNRTACSFHTNVVRPLRALNYDVHVFAVAPEDELAPQLQLLHRMPQVHAHITILPAMDFPASCTEYTMAHYHQPSLHWWGRKRYTYVFLEQVFLKWKAEELRKAYERRTGQRFEWVVWLRPDVLYADPLPPLDRLNASQLWVPRWGSDFKGINDRALIAPAALSSLYLDLYKGLCIDNLPFPHNFPSERIHRWFVRQGRAPDSLNFLDDFRFMRLRISQHLPVDSEAVDYFEPSVRRCRNYFIMKEAWWIRSLQLQCSEGHPLKPVSQFPVDVPRCVPFSRPLSPAEAAGESRLAGEEHLSLRYQLQPLRQPKLSPLKRLRRNVRQRPLL
eukprot:GGOE01003786.1.p1 GENE.GGOE01003786.1~~GGOE01003786.1.p1  ORF type:complete len:369 (-),score=99.74 GGOE01003786.1:283-1389(-)